jgi:hypothetical protein
MSDRSVDIVDQIGLEASVEDVEAAQTLSFGKMFEYLESTQCERFGGWRTHSGDCYQYAQTEHEWCFHYHSWWRCDIIGCDYAGGKSVDIHNCDSCWMLIGDKSGDTVKPHYCGDPSLHESDLSGPMLEEPIYLNDLTGHSSWVTESTPSKAYEAILNWWIGARVSVEEDLVASQVVHGVNNLTDVMQYPDGELVNLGPKRVRISKASLLGQRARAVIDCTRRTSANTQAVKIWIIKEMVTEHVRYADYNFVLYNAIEAAFIPSNDEITSNRMRASQAILNSIMRNEEVTYSQRKRRWFHLWRRRETARPIGTG